MPLSGTQSTPTGCRRATQPGSSRAPIGRPRNAGLIPRGATWAQQLLRQGATYVLVLGRPLVARDRQDRLEALQQEAGALGLAPGAIRLYDGNQLARWASAFPARALDRRLGGPGPVVLDFDRWSASPEHRERWVECASRTDVAAAIDRIASGSLSSYRLEGGTGLGKTKIVMERLRSSAARFLVVYSPRGEQISTEMLTYLADGGRSCVLVVDNRSRLNHQSILEQLGTGGVRLITIGSESDERLLRTPLQQLPPATLRRSRRFFEITFLHSGRKQCELFKRTA